MKNLPDMQSTQTGFPKIPIEKVGVRGIVVPITLYKKSGGLFSTTATVSSYCSLVENIKGINMSRISRTINDVLSKQPHNIGFVNLNEFVTELKHAHGADDVYIKAEFKYLMELVSPVTQLPSYEPVDVIMESVLKTIDNVSVLKTYLTVSSTEMSLCPCSKEMSSLMNNLNESELEEISKLSQHTVNKLKLSGFGAHNQKSNITVTVESDKIFYIEDLVDIIKQSSSCPTFIVLKRPDEKWVTEVSYTGGYFDDSKSFVKVGSEDQYGPKFVEDISRLIAEKLNKLLDNEINDYVIVVNNEESIHSGDLQATSILTAGRYLK